MSKDDALRKCLRVLEPIAEQRMYEAQWVVSAILACKEALKQSTQEPVAEGLIRQLISVDEHGIETWNEKKFYTQPKEWQGLGEDDINKIQGGFCKGQYYVPDLIKAIEQKLKEKNT